MNVEQYYEYRDKYFGSDEGTEISDVPRSVLIDTASKLQISATINKAKGFDGIPSTYESLKSSENTIDEEIANMLTQEGEHSEEKLNLTKTRYKDDGKIRVAGLKGDVYLDDSFFELKPSESKNVKPSQKSMDSPKKSMSSESSENASTVKDNLLLTQIDSDDESYQRAKARYSMPTIGVEGQYNSPQFKTKATLNSYFDAAFEKLQIESKSSKGTSSKTVLSDIDKAKNGCDVKYSNSIEKKASTPDEESIEVLNQEKNDVKKSTKAKFYTPQGLYKLKKEF